MSRQPRFAYCKTTVRSERSFLHIIEQHLFYSFGDTVFVRIGTKCGILPHTFGGVVHYHRGVSILYHLKVVFAVTENYYVLVGHAHFLFKKYQSRGLGDPLGVNSEYPAKR